MSIRLRSLAAAGLLGGVLVLVTPLPASAASYAVTTTNDTVDANIGDGICADAGGDCSLRAAVQEANTTAVADSINLGANTYVLDVGTAGEDAAAQGDLDITGSMNIQGVLGTKITTTLADRFFDVKAGGYLSLRTLTLDGGAANGATPEGASGGAIINSGQLEASQINLVNNVSARAGGAIEIYSDDAQAVIRDSTFTNNSTGPAPANGGAVHNNGAASISIIKSEFDNNRAATQGGALWVSATGTMIVSNSTIKDGSAAGVAAGDGGGGIFNGGTLDVSAGSIMNNDATGANASGGGIFNAGTATIIRVPIEGNSAPRAGGGIEVTGGSSTFMKEGTLASNRAGPNPGNGGGLHITGAGLVNLDKVDVSLNTASEEGGGLWNSSVGTLKLTDTTVSGNTAAGVLATDGGGGIFNQPKADNTGGGTLTVTGGDIMENKATGTAGSGGGVLNGGTATITGTHIEKNTAVRAGGGIEVVGGSNTTVTGGSLAINSAGAAPGNGGGLHITGNGIASIDRTDVTRNIASSEGGGLWVSSTGTLDVVGASVTNNSAVGIDPDNGGGGIFNDGGTLTVTASKVNQNGALGAAGSGGGIFNGGTATVTDSNVDLNSANRAGGGVEAIGGSTTTIENSSLSGNDAVGAPGNGGGVHITGNGTATISRSGFIQNKANLQGGGLWVSATATVTVSRSGFFENTAKAADVTSRGGAIYNDGATMSVSDSLMVANEADSGGGVFGANSARTNLTHVTLTKNEAATGAGVSAAPDSSSSALEDSIVSGNVGGGDDCAGAIADIGGNVAGSCALSDTNDITGINDPLLGANYVPTAASPAIDRALTADTVDYLGVVRPLDGNGDGTARGDSGALEAPGVPPTDTTTSTSTTTTPGGATSTTPGKATTTPSGNAGNNRGLPGRGTRSDGTGGGSLARTGSSPVTLVGLGLALLAVGGLVFGSRRRLALARVRR